SSIASAARGRQFWRNTGIGAPRWGSDTKAHQPLSRARESFRPANRCRRNHQWTRIHTNGMARDGGGGESIEVTVQWALTVDANTMSSLVFIGVNWWLN